MLITGKVIAPTTRGLPKTGQETSYNTKDDGDIEQGWWFSRLNANNKERFYERELVSGEVVVVDRATGLMWPKDWNSDATDSQDTKNWIDAVNFCRSLSYSGLREWYLPNVYEMFSLADISQISPPIVQNVFDNVLTGANYWTSSTAAILTTYAYRVLYSADIIVSKSDKTAASGKLVPVRLAV